MCFHCSFCLATCEYRNNLSFSSLMINGRCVAIGKSFFDVIRVAKLNRFIKSTIFFLSVILFIFGIYMLAKIEFCKVVGSLFLSFNLHSESRLLYQQYNVASIFHYLNILLHQYKLHACPEKLPVVS